MVKIIVVANNRQITPINLDRQLDKADLIVRLGKSYMVNDDRTNLFFLRKSDNRYTGADEKTLLIKPAILRSPDVKYIAIDDAPLLKQIVDKNKIKLQQIIQSDPVAKQYGLECPSSGLVVVEYLLKKYPNDQVYIMNFSWEGWSGHSWTVEKKIFKQHLASGRVKMFPESVVNSVQNSQVRLNLSVQNSQAHYGAYVINLDSRKDRWVSISQHMKQFADIIQPIRYSALSPPDGNKSHGWIYLAKTIFKIVKQARREMAPYVIILEDDNRFNPAYKDHLRETFAWLKNNLGKWDVFNGNPSNVKQRDQKPFVIGRQHNIICYDWGKSTNFTVYNRSAYDRLLTLEDFYRTALQTPHSKGAIDIKFCELGLRHVTRVPFLSYQEPSFSDLTGHFSNYINVFEESMRDLAQMTGLKVATKLPVKFETYKNANRVVSFPKIVRDGRTVRYAHGIRRNIGFRLKL
jgi:hypothetical protein